MNTRRYPRTSAMKPHPIGPELRMRHRTPAPYPRKEKPVWGTMAVAVVYLAGLLIWERHDPHARQQPPRGHR